MSFHNSLSRLKASANERGACRSHNDVIVVRHDLKALLTDWARLDALVRNSQPAQKQCAWPVGEFDNCRNPALPGKRYCENCQQWETHHDD